MAKYLIHSCEKRKWYVDKYLVPSLLNQGIKRENVLVYNDNAKQGNLRAYMASSEMIQTTESGTWHLQDDIIISKNFRRVTEEFDKGLVCGFCNTYSKDMPIGIHLTKDMWYSFPCIRIPNHILKEFIEWLKSAPTQNRYRAYIEANKFDDSLFRFFMLYRYPDMIIHNLYPNLVDNIDYLLGGSIINYQRDSNPNSLYFVEPELIEDLQRKLQYTSVHT